MIPDILRIKDLELIYVYYCVIDIAKVKFNDTVNYTKHAATHRK